VSAGRSTTRVTVTNTAPAPTGPWTLTFRLPGGQQLVRGSDASWRQSGDVIVAKGGGLPADATASTWFDARYADVARLPQSFALNDVVCLSELSVQGPPAVPAATKPVSKPKPATAVATHRPKTTRHRSAPAAKGPAAHLLDKLRHHGRPKPPVPPHRWPR
jgi:hypothetical protein